MDARVIVGVEHLALHLSHVNVCVVVVAHRIAAQDSGQPLRWSIAGRQLQRRLPLAQVR